MKPKKKEEEEEEEEIRKSISNDDNNFAKCFLAFSWCHNSKFRIELAQCENEHNKDYSNNLVECFCLETSKMKKTSL